MKALEINNLIINYLIDNKFNYHFNDNSNTFEIFYNKDWLAYVVNDQINKIIEFKFGHSNKILFDYESSIDYNNSNLLIDELNFISMLYYNQIM